MAKRSLPTPSVARRRLVAAMATTVLAGGAGLTALTPVAAAAPAATARPAFGTIWVVNNQSDPQAITEYAPGAHGDVAPIATIAGADTGLVDADGIVVTPIGALWVANSSSDELTEYAPGAHGDVTPIATISGAKTGLSVPTAVARAQDGSLWVMNLGGTESLAHFAADAKGDVAPIATITGSKTGLHQTRGIALTPDDKHIWVTVSGSPVSAVLEFATSAGGNIGPVRTIKGSSTTLGASPYGVAVDAAGEVIVSADQPAALLTFAAGANGNAAPIRTVSGASSSITQPSLLDLDALGDIWLEDYAASTVLEESPAADGDVGPKRMIAGAKTALGHPTAIAVYSTVPSAPRQLSAHRQKHHKVALSWGAPISDGGGILRYAVSLRKPRHGSWKAVGTAHGTSLTVAHLTVQKGYRFSVAAINNDGTSPRSTPATAS